MLHLPEPLVSLSRRKLRSALSALGVAAGIFAMELIASVSQHFRLTSHQFQENFSRRVFVCDRVSFWSGGGILSDAKVGKVAGIAGVAEVVPLLIGRLLPDRLIVLGVPEVMVGLPPDLSSHLWPQAQLSAGHWLQGPAPGAVVGGDVATLLQARIGGEVTLFGRSVPVVGLVRPSGTLVDRQVLVPLALAQELQGRDGLVTGMVVEPAAGVATEVVAAALRTALPTVRVVTPEELQGDVQRSVAVWDALAAVLGLGAALSGAATVAVTTVVSVHERTAEIGIRRAIGASRGQIFAEFLTETGVLTTLGWALGTAGAVLFVRLAQPWLESVGAAIFSITGSLVAASLGVSVLLGLLAGIGPAYAATRVDVVGALRRV